MPVKGLKSFRRYRVAAKHRAGLEEIVERLGRRRFVPLEPESDDEERWGWITSEHLLDTRFDVGKCARDPFVVFALRVDRRKAPAALVRAHLKIEEEAHRKESGGKPLRPQARRELRDEIRAKLLAQVLPSAQSVEVAWSLRAGRIYFGSTGARMNELFRSLFEDTFDVELTALDPLGLAEAVVGSAEGEVLARLVTAQPTRLGCEAGASGAEEAVQALVA